jgi:hypothetical protein
MTTPPRLNILTLGRLGITDEEGQQQRIVIQRVGRKFGNGRILNGRYQLQVRRHVETVNDPKTTAQLERRAVFQAAVSSWQQMPEEQKAEWRRSAKRRRPRPTTGYNLFISSRLNQSE